jgi:transposase
VSLHLSERSTRKDGPVEFLGIDVSKSQLHLVLLQNEKPPARKTINNNAHGFEQLASWLRNRKCSNLHACLEATGIYGEAIAEYLYDLGHTVSVVNPIQIKAFGRSAMVRTKTDDVDALLIADFCKALRPLAWTPAPLEIRQLRALVRRRETLSEMITAETNRLESALSAEVRNSITSHIEFLKRSLKDLEDEMNDHLTAHPEVRDIVNKLDDIPGFGPLTAMKVIAETNGFSVCETSRQIVAYAGLNPRQYQSGNISRRGRISKVGNASLRKALFFAALSAKRYSEYFRPFVKRLEAAGKRPKVIVTAIMRKLLVLAHTLVSKGVRFNPAIHA